MDTLNNPFKYPRQYCGESLVGSSVDGVPAVPSYGAACQLQLYRKIVYSMVDSMVDSDCPQYEFRPPFGSAKVWCSDLEHALDETQSTHPLFLLIQASGAGKSYTVSLFT